MEAKMQRLNIATSSKATQPSKAKTKTPVADTWDEDLDSDDQETTETKGKTSIPNAPPPTPSSPGAHFPAWSAIDGEISAPRSAITAADARVRSRDEDSRRPEKSTAVAGRLIAAGLGVKAPKRTEEQRAYDRAAKEKEIRRRNQEKEAATRAQEEAEKAKTAMWDG